MKVLIVCSYKPLLAGGVAPFISDQADAVANLGVEVDYFLIKGKGIKGYLMNYRAFRKKLRVSRPDVIHAHYGLSGLFANLQRRVPVVTTYHGSDINDPKVFRFSKIAIGMSAWNVFVNPKSSNGVVKMSVIPCGVDMDLFAPKDRDEARLKLGLDRNKKYVLFAGAFDNPVKNFELADKAVREIAEIELLELKGYKREEVSLLMSAVDAVLMTSHSEGSPQFIKEALACNCPVVSVPVGDVPEVLSDIEGCFLTTYDSHDIADKLKFVIKKCERIDGRKRIIEYQLDSKSIATRVIEVYRKICSR